MAEGLKLRLPLVNSGAQTAAKQRGVTTVLTVANKGEGANRSILVDLKAEEYEELKMLADRANKPIERYAAEVLRQAAREVGKGMNKEAFKSLYGTPLR